MENSHLTIDVETKAGKDEITIMYSRLVCAGWVGRDREALQAHIDAQWRYLDGMATVFPAKTRNSAV